jgi:CMP-N-acetylneuraminic acid synthetase
MKKIVISLIPAKGRSRSIKNKNLLKIYNKTLLEIAILSSLNCSNINKTFVSSESEKILNIARKYNCEIVKRPKKLSKFNARGIEVIRHFCKSLSPRLKKMNPIILVLQPTSPLRSIIDINRSIKIFKRKKARALISVKKNEVSPFKDMVIVRKKLVPIANIKNIYKNRQEFPQTYKPNGAIFIFNYKDVFKNNIFSNKEVYPYIMNDISSLDIDKYKDFTKSISFFKKVHGKFF